MISLLFSAGVSAWIYGKLQRQTGNNTQKSAIATAVSGAVLFLLLYTALGLTL